MKYLFTLFLLAFWAGTSHAGFQIMKCVGTGGFVTYTRTCSNVDTISRTQMNVFGIATNRTDANSNANSNEESKTNSNSKGAKKGLGKNSSAGVTANNNQFMKTNNSPGKVPYFGFSRTTTTTGGIGAFAFRNTNKKTTDTKNPTVTSTESEAVTEETESLDDGNTINTDSDDTSISADSSSGSDNTDSTNPDEGETDSSTVVNTDSSNPDESETDSVVNTDSANPEEGETDSVVNTDIINIDISESLSDEYNHSVSSIRIDQDNEEITVNGLGFGSGPDVILYDRFENGVTDGVIPLTNSDNPACWSDSDNLDIREKQGPFIGCWSEYGTGKPRYSDIAYSGNHSMQIHDNTTGMLQFKKNFDNSTEVFMSYWVHVPQTENSYFPGTYWFREDGTVGGINDASHGVFSKDSSWKMNWLLQDGKYDQLYANMVLPSHVGQGIFHLAGNDNSLANLGRADNWWSWDYWNRISVWIKADTDNPLSPGEVLFQAISQDMGFYQASTSVPIFDDDGPDGKYFNSINFPGWIRPGSLTEPLYDDIYIATGPNAVSRVEIGNSASYHLSGKVEILQSVSWRDDQITLLFDSKRGLVPDGKKFYLYVTDNRGRVNKKGYPLYE